MSRAADYRGDSDLSPAPGCGRQGCVAKALADGRGPRVMEPLGPRERSWEGSEALFLSSSPPPFFSLGPPCHEEDGTNTGAPGLPALLGVCR